MNIKQRILDIDDKEASLACIFSTRSYPSYAEKILDCVDLKLKYLKEQKKLDKLLVTIPGMKNKELVYRVLDEAKSAWKLGVDNSPEAIAYLNTNKKFVNKRKERYDIAIVDPDVPQFLAYIDELHQKLEGVGLEPIKIHKVQTVIGKELKIFLDFRAELDEEIEELEKKCKYLYRGMR